MDIHKNARSCPASRALLVERVMVQGWSVAEASAAVGLSERRGREWLRRYREKGLAGLMDRSSRPRQFLATSSDVEEQIVRLRREQRLTCRRIAAMVPSSTATVARILGRRGLSRLHVQPQVPPVRYECERPGQLLHIDTKRLARIHGVGHRITGDRRGQHRGGGYDAVHVCIDDRTRLAYVEILADEQASSALPFLQRAVEWFAARGVIAERVMTDNGSAYKSHAFAGLCRSLGLRHTRTRPYTPRTNGKAERLIQTLLREWAYCFTFHSSAQRQALLGPYLHFYNHHRSHRSLGEQPPISRLTRNNVLRPDS